MSAESTEPDLPEIHLRSARERVLDSLRGLQRFALEHPQAAKALFAGLAEEGRKYGQTARGARWRSRIAGSLFADRAHLVLQSSTSWMLEEQDRVLPSALVDALVVAARSDEADRLLDELFRSLDAGEVNDGEL